MAGVRINKAYLDTSVNRGSIANNWFVLVYGVTNRGPNKPTFIPAYGYADFINQFGTAVTGYNTHNYVKLLLDRGIPVLFRRLVQNSALSYAEIDMTSPTKTIEVTEGEETKTKPLSLFTVKANESYEGTAGNNISFGIITNANGVLNFIVNYNNTTVETIPIAVSSTGIYTANSQLTNNDVALFEFFKELGNTKTSAYISIEMLSTNVNDWEGFAASIIDKKDGDNFVYQKLSGATDAPTDSNYIYALLANKLKDSETSKPVDSDIYKDRKIQYAITYYPELRFVTTGGICNSLEKDITKDELKESSQNAILKQLGLFATAAQLTFRVLADFPIDTSAEDVRNFASTVGKDGGPDPSVFAYFGPWGADDNNNWLPGSAGFLTALANNGYNVYSRRIAGSSFRPSFIKAYDDLYIDTLKDWQSEQKIQLNPILVVDSQDNLAVMGASTLSPVTINVRNPKQALDIVLVGDYVGALLNGLALNQIENSLTRLNLSTLNSNMESMLNRFVTSEAITRYTLNFDVTTLGKLKVYCTLYFAIGLEEVEITVTSVYDTEVYNTLSEE